MNKKALSKKTYYIWSGDKQYKTKQRCLRRAIQVFVNKIDGYIDYVECSYIDNNGEFQRRAIPKRYLYKMWDRCQKRKNITI